MTNQRWNKMKGSYKNHVDIPLAKISKKQVAQSNDIIYQPETGEIQLNLYNYYKQFLCRII